MDTATAATETVIIAQDAPIGVLLWPVRHPQYADNFTLASVHVIRDETGSRVVWNYRNGTVRRFALGESVVVKF